MSWDDDLLPEQRNAAGHVGAHARLLAGPGTGKTRSLTKRICFLIEEKNINPLAIFALTFTRAAAHELRQRVEAEVGVERVPKISTLHSFALRQLLINSVRLTTLPQPLRIADDWEERHIILEDLKTLLTLNRIDVAQDLLNDLSADWQRLTADEADWAQRFPNPSFLGAWREHREIYGYVLRAELVYQLKRAFEQHDDFTLEEQPLHLLVDEYQDLNRCDLAVVKAICDKGAEVYAAGDDDQSIYGFRKAHPEGIRLFPQHYPGARELALDICKRCDEEILELGLFVASQDYNRIQKPLHADVNRTGGEIALLRFDDQNKEAQGVASICHHLIRERRVKPDKILVLLRADRNGAFSSVLRQALESQDLPVEVASTDSDPLNEDPGRQVLAFLRLLTNAADHLAWRALFKLRNNGLGPLAVEAVYRVAKGHTIRFADALQKIYDNPSLGGKFGGRIKTEMEIIRTHLRELSAFLPSGEEEGDGTDLMPTIKQIVNHIVESESHKEAIEHQFELTIKAAAPSTITDLVRAIEVSKEDIEQELDKDKINILTMHKAKGLTAEAVIIVAAEDEYLPGRAVGDSIDDERRLLYVSLTRAEHYLFITYCNNRSGTQRHTGRTSGQSRRTLTRFLQDAPIEPVLGQAYVASLREAHS